jgi:hypothetical protein
MIKVLKIVRMVVELKVFFLKILYHWMTAYDCFYIFSFHYLFIYFHFLVCTSFILPVYMVAPFAFQ